MERISFYEQISKNKLKSFFLIFVIFLVFLLIGFVISRLLDPGYFFFVMILSIIISISFILTSYYNSDKIVLSAVNAKPASREHRQYYHSVEGLCLAAGLPMPRLYIMENEQINAFATGRDPKHAAICVTTGALKKLNKQELEGVLAHELSHIANYDIRFMTLVAVLVGMIAILSELFLRSLWFGKRGKGRGNAVFLLIGILLAILAPIVVQLVQFSISRKREFMADATGVKLTRYPLGLANALRKIKREKATRVNKALEPLFISDPLKRKIDEKKGFWADLFSTHPPIDQRIALLERM